MQNKIVIDLSALLPCCNVHQIHSERTNFVAKLWGSVLKNKIDKQSFANHGWDEYGDIRWIDQAFLNNSSGILFEDLYNDEHYDFGRDNEESENENKEKRNNSCLVT